MTPPSVGAPLARVDGRLKVTGAATYAAEFNQVGQAYAVVVGAAVGLGTILRIDASACERMPGVLAVISHLNAPKLAYRPHKSAIDPAIGERLHVLQDPEVRFYGQPVAVVVATTLEQAEQAATCLHIAYEGRQPMVGLTSVSPSVPEAGLRPGSRVAADNSRGDADAAISSSPIKVSATYDIARENHNPMEPHATVAAWSGERLTLWSKSQFVVNEAAEIAAVFGLPASDVLVICPFIGGAFGTSLRTWPHVTLAAMAARHVGRPVKLVLTRRQMFHTTGHRPATTQRISLGAARDGRLTGIVHEGLGETSRHEQFIEALTSVSAYMYLCQNVRSRYRLAQTDSGTSTHMRGPGESSGIYALECAMDELAVALEMDPVELRLRNDTPIDQNLMKPFSSRALAACFEEGARRFGWAARRTEPRSMRDGRLLLGWGTAGATYPAFQNQASARVRVLANGTVEVEAAASDMGPGTTTSMAQVAADVLGVVPACVRVSLGRSDFPPTPPHGGSQTMASVGSAVGAAARAAIELLKVHCVGAPASPHYGLEPNAVVSVDGGLRGVDDPSRFETFAAILARVGRDIVGEASAQRNADSTATYSMHAFGALFVEVAVDPDLGLIRVRRALGVYGAGRIINPRLAASQCTGGMVGGIGMALMERTLLDPRDGRPVNASMADYLVPVNLDIGRLEAYFVDEVDPHVNPLGVKGLGEIALIGMAPAIANAVFHATGKRVRELPIRLEHIF